MFGILFGLIMTKKPESFMDLIVLHANPGNHRGILPDYGPHFDFAESYLKVLDFVEREMNKEKIGPGPAEFTIPRYDDVR